MKSCVFRSKSFTDLILWQFLETNWIIRILVYNQQQSSVFKRVNQIVNMQWLFMKNNTAKIFNALILIKAQRIEVYKLV